MSDRQINETAKVLIKAKGLIADPGKWCQGRLRAGDSYCAIGALNEAASNTKPGFGGLAFGCLAAAEREMFGLTHAEGALHPIAAVNDTLGFEAVHKLYSHAIARALQGVES